MINLMQHGDLLEEVRPTKNPVLRILGRKGGGKGGGGASNDANTLRSKALFNLIEAISEGPIEGLVNGENSIYFDQTPLKNADGTYNFKELTWALHKGTPDEGYFTGHNGVETPVNVEVQVKAANGPTVRTIVDENADAVRVICRIPSLVHQDNKGGLKRTSLSYAIDVRAYNGTWQEVVVQKFNNEKALSPSQVSHRVPLPLNGSPWDVRIRRITPDSTDDKLQNDLYWEGYVILVEGKFSYPMTAALAMNGNAEQMGTNIPPRSYHIKGLRVNVPSNYNPVTRAYAGLWDGTWKIAWTNNPAWVFYDLLINDRYGLGEFIKPEIVDKWSLYTIAQYCDQLVPSGFKNGDTGAEIMEPRFTFNGVINTKDEAFFVLQNITKAWRGMGYWALGQVFATTDMPSDPVKLVGPANVIGGEFEYGGTAEKARHSVVMVKWNNPDDFYRPDTEVVIDTDLLHKSGWRDKTLTLQGCTSRGLAHRYGKWVIDTEQHETDTLTYSASWDHVELRPGELIAVSDPRKANIRAHGRVASHKGLTVELDAPFEYTVGETYQLMLTMPDSSIETKPILAFLDDQTVRVSAAFSQECVPDATWTIKGSDITPRLFRVISVDETEPNIFKITALFHDPLKYDRIEKGIAFEALPYERASKIAVPPSNLTVKETGYISGGQQYTSLTVSWTPPLNFLARGFVVAADTPDGESFTIGTTTDSYMELQTTIGGDYKFYVQTIGYTGLMSEAATIEYSATGPEGFTPPTVQDLESVDKPGTALFESRDLKVRWKNMFSITATGDVEHVSSPHYAFNTVSIYHGGTGELLRADRVVGEAYNYDYAMNVADCAALGKDVPSRVIRVDVTVTDVFGRTSPEITKVFSNPVPASITPTYNVVGSTIFMGFPEPKDLDYQGVIIYRSEEPGKIDTDADEPIYQGRNNPLTIQGEPETAYFFKMAAYDSFGLTDLNWGSEFVITTLSDGADLDPPETPSGLKATSALVNGRARVTVEWNANTEEDLAGYDLQIRQNGGNWVSFVVVNGPYEFDAISGFSYQIRIRARDKVTNASPYSDAITHVAIKDTTPPGRVTNPKVTAGLSSLWLDWSNPSDEDLAFIEVWEGETNDRSKALKIAEVRGASFARTGLANEVERFYWMRAVDTSENAGAFSDVVTATTAVLPDAKRVTIVGLTLTPNQPAANRVSWSEFTMAVGIPGKAPITSTIKAGNAAWTNGSLYLYYVEGETTLRTTTQLSTIFVNSGYPIGIYRGDTDIQLAEGKVMMDGNNLIAGTVGANQLVVNDAIITSSLQLKDAVITSAKIQDLDAGKIKADTTISNQIIVGENGDTLGTIRDRAADPAKQVNAGTTIIEPGFIGVGGGQKLTSWMAGPDSSEINGGAVAANSLKANTAVIGMRGINIDGITFEHNSPSANRVSWTAGTIAYTDDNGASVTKAITAGNVLWTSGTIWLYWIKGQTVVRSTTDFSVANGDNNVVLASYKGTVFLFASYGRTIIDGGQLKTQSITADQLAVGSVSAQAISVTSLAAINANLGAITGGSLNINNRFMVAADGTMTLRSASTGARLVITNQLVQVFDENNVERVRMGIW